MLTVNDESFPCVLSDGEDDSDGASTAISDPKMNLLQPSRHRYHHLTSASKRQQRHYFYYSLVVIIIALVLYIATFLAASDRPPPLKLSQDSPRGLRCSDSPADCETVAPYIFDSIYALAKQWPNSYAPNGHSVVPVTFPRNMPLYHANFHEGPVTGRTWFAFDVEMSIGIYGGSGITFLHTAIPSRRLNLLYFDGESATLTASGSLDSQTALLRQGIELNPSDEFTYNESARGDELCALAQELRIDGYMRMNAGFEVLACNVESSGVKEIHVSNVTVPGNYIRERDPNLPQDPNRQPPLGFGNTFASEYSWDWVRSVAWHYGGFGNADGTRQEHRVDINLYSIVTYYNPLLHSLSGKHVGGARGKDQYENGWGLRRGHRLLDISRKDALQFKEWVQQSLYHHRKLSIFDKFKRLFKAPFKCSNSNWQLITEVIVDSHRSRATEIAHVFSQFTSGHMSMNTTMIHIHELSHGVLVPFFQYPRGDTLTLTDVRDQTISRCASLFTSHLDTNSFNDFEGLLKDSIHIVLDRLCHWEWELFEWSENRTTNIFRNSQRVTEQHAAEPTLGEINYYSNETQTILRWLGWSSWTDCPTKCGIGEICYIPMWPVVYSNGTRQGGIYAGSQLSKEEEEYFWTPKCISREAWAKAGGRGRDPEHQIPPVPGNGGNSDH